MLQLPLPAHLDAAALLARIADDKDVDCLKASSVRRSLARAEPTVCPCIAAAVEEVLRSLDGRVVNRSDPWTDSDILRAHLTAWPGAGADDRGVADVPVPLARAARQQRGGAELLPHVRLRRGGDPKPKPQPAAAAAAAAASGFGSRVVYRVL